MMTRFFYIIFLCVSIIGCSGVDPANEKAVRQPNVIFILADDLGYSELGAYGNSFNETPFVDSLASIGMKFTNAYAPAPVCSPYRAALMTGQHPARIGITDYLRPHGDEHLNEDLTTVAELFKQVGYTTGMIGKWHLSGYEKNGARESPPQNHGFDEVILNEQRGISGGSYFFPYHFNTEAKQKIFPVEFLTDRQNLEAVEFIRRNKDKPFFLYQSHYSVHTNLNGPDSLVQKYSQKDGAGLSPESSQNNVHLAAQLERIDYGVGMILEELKKQGILENTIIVFTSDNGGETNVTSNAPLRAGKSTLYEGGIRVPMIIYGEALLKESATVDIPTVNMDFYSTFREILDIAPDQREDGYSLLSLLADGEPSEELVSRPLFWHYPLNAPHFLGGFSSGAIRWGDYKLIQNFTNQEISLYNLSSDISEKVDLSDELPQLKDSLLNELKSWRSGFQLEEVPHTVSRTSFPKLPDADKDPVFVTVNGEQLPFLNYGVSQPSDGVFEFNGGQNFLKLLHLHIPDVTMKHVEMGATVDQYNQDGVIICHGEEVFGLVLFLEEGIAKFATTKYGKLVSISSDQKIEAGAKLKAELTSTGEMLLHVDDQIVARANIGEPLPIPPDDPISIGYDFRRQIAQYSGDGFFKGQLSDVYFRTH